MVTYLTRAILDSLGLLVNVQTENLFRISKPFRNIRPTTLHCNVFKNEDVRYDELFFTSPNLKMLNMLPRCSQLPHQT